MSIALTTPAQNPRGFNSRTVFSELGIIPVSKYNREYTIIRFQNYRAELGQSTQLPEMVRISIGRELSTSQREPFSPRRYGGHGGESVRRCNFRSLGNVIYATFLEARCS